MGKQDMVAWMPHDDIKILELQRTLGPRWSAIASQFPARTVSSVRNRWLRLQAGEKIRDAGKITKNRCQLCGLPKRGHICEVKLRNTQQHPLVHVLTHAQLPLASATVSQQQLHPQQPHAPHALAQHAQLDDSSAAPSSTVPASLIIRAELAEEANIRLAACDGADLAGADADPLPPGLPPRLLLTCSTELPPTPAITAGLVVDVRAEAESVVGDRGSSTPAAA